MTADAPPSLRSLQRDLDLCVERLRSLGPVRVAAVGPAARGLAQRLADLGAQAEGRSPGREVPALAPYAAGDQVAVTGADLLAALHLVAPPVAGPLIAQAREAIAGLRRVLP